MKNLNSLVFIISSISYVLLKNPNPVILSFGFISILFFQLSNSELSNLIKSGISLNNEMLINSKGKFQAVSINQFIPFNQQITSGGNATGLLKRTCINDPYLKNLLFHNYNNKV